MSGYNYDYSQTLWMKMFLARPDFKAGRSEVLITFEQALDIIKVVDAVTLGLTKIVYLVGWQGLGHDDCYPEMEKVNDYLNRAGDRDGRESLLWLAAEAKKYHTVISFHGNIADEYADNASHAEIVAANAVVNDMHGDPAVIEVFNGRDAYKISYKQYYESGLFKKYWDRFMQAVPVREAGTVHLDNFCVAESLNPRTDVDAQIRARDQMIAYINSCGIDVTSEYTYRELLWRADSPDHPIRRLYGQANPDLPVASFEAGGIHCLGRIAASWWMSSLTPRECVEIPPGVYSGRLTDRALFNVFYGAMHGEDIWLDRGNDPSDWLKPFVRQFCLEQLPYMYLNRHRRLGLQEDTALAREARFTARFEGGVVSRAEDMSIAKDGAFLKRGGDVILPLSADNKTFVAYSEAGRSGDWPVPDAAFTRCDLFDVTAEGMRPIGPAEVAGGLVRLDLRPGRMVALVARNG